MSLIQLPPSSNGNGQPKPPAKTFDIVVRILFDGTNMELNKIQCPDWLQQEQLGRLLGVVGSVVLQKAANDQAERILVARRLPDLPPPNGGAHGA